MSESDLPQTNDAPQKEDDLPSLKSKDKEAVQREKREKKESLKKRESKGDVVIIQQQKISSNKSTDSNSVKPIRYLFPKPTFADYGDPPPPSLNLHHTSKINGQETSFYEPDRVSNRKGYRFSPCQADKNFPATVFRKTELHPQQARLSFQDSSPSILFDKTISHATTEKGFRLARANVGVREGRWYWECRITSGIAGAARRDRCAQYPEESTSLQANGHVRIGWARLEASLEAPVGYDAYSYAIRDVAGQKVHMSRPADFFPPDTSIVEGDVIGLEINLPSLNLHQKVVQGDYNPAVDQEESGERTQPKGSHIIRDRALCNWKSSKYFEQFEYCSTKDLEDLCHPTNDLATRTQPHPTHHNPLLRTLPSSKIRIYKNGQLVGEPFTGLLAFLPPASKPGAPEAREGMDDGCLGYYPAVSCFRGGAVEVNFGPDFWAPPSVKEEGQEENGPQLRPLFERYAEQVAEDTVQDIIDEVKLALNPPEGLSSQIPKADIEGPQHEIKDLLQGEV